MGTLTNVFSFFLKINTSNSSLIYTEDGGSFENNGNHSQPSESL